MPHKERGVTTVYLKPRWLETSHWQFGKLLLVYIYHPRTKLQEGNVFTGVCPHWGCIPACNYPPTPGPYHLCTPCPPTPGPLHPLPTHPSLDSYHSLHVLPTHPQAPTTLAPHLHPLVHPPWPYHSYTPYPLTPGPHTDPPSVPPPLPSPPYPSIPCAPTTPTPKQLNSLNYIKIYLSLLIWHDPTH